ncbi:hypothetical protein L6452_00022 [Arctium lappa]|uniref:Uncharacterized protein n=1 Tax=Arctium lappa TaxID=4217 RepID=A0ACB9FE01_ARCLA|nr:hypothetical protein L6452_00022 [Arctium lappa]
MMFRFVLVVHSMIFFETKKQVCYVDVCLVTEPLSIHHSGRIIIIIIKSNPNINQLFPSFDSPFSLQERQKNNKQIPLQIHSFTCLVLFVYTMVSPENTNWIYEYGLIEDIQVPDANFTTLPAASGFTWPIQPTFTSNPSAELDGSIVDSDGHNDSRPKKRGRPESCSGTSSKACREKLRRDKLNDKFVELASILEPGRPPKIDKAAILVDAVRMVTQLRREAQKLKDSSLELQEKIKELKAEKNELRDEKQRLKMEKEKLEQQANTVNAAQPSFMATPPTIPAAAFARGQAVGNKLVPVISYPGMAMWQFMPPAAVDTSQDHVLHPPVA